MKNVKTYCILVAVMIVWGINVPATKVLVTNFAPVTMTALRVFTAGLAVFLFMAAAKKLRLPTAREAKYVFIASIFNVLAHHYFLSIGLKGTSGTNGGLILGTGPLWTTVLAVMFLGTKFTVLRGLGLLLGFTGVSFIVLQGSSVSGIAPGDLLVFLSVLVQAVSFIMVKRLTATMDARLITSYMMLMGSSMLFVIGLIQEPAGLESMTHGTPQLWAVFFASAIVATAMGHMLYNQAMGVIGAAEASIFINLNPCFALLSSVVLLDEVISAVQVLGFLLILAGVIFGSGAAEDLIARQHKRRHKGKRELPVE
ncbi:DMT family transporter [Fictibacillus aquaticus]|uniref:EamA family transporter n=1 Tax=Fictibacillus aquaticus TaxID=2021314 RepID=A0A235FE99_9BACL|nr:DMT family transporter [Fictibacillus aquaticus]OYD59303.1 EamA family transporter [Fictibacillus aquaticus]